MTELIAMMMLGIVRGSIEPHFVNDFEPAVAESAQSIGVALVLLAVMLIVNVGPGATRQAVISEKMDGMTEMFVAGPTLVIVAALS